MPCGEPLGRGSRTGLAARRGRCGDSTHAIAFAACRRQDPFGQLKVSFAARALSIAAKATIWREASVHHHLSCDHLVTLASVAISTPSCTLASPQYLHQVCSRLTRSIAARVSGHHMDPTACTADRTRPDYWCGLDYTRCRAIFPRRTGHHRAGCIYMVLTRTWYGIAS